MQRHSYRRPNSPQQVSAAEVLDLVIQHRFTPGNFLRGISLSEIQEKFPRKDPVFISSCFTAMKAEGLIQEIIIDGCNCGHFPMTTAMARAKNPAMVAVPNFKNYQSYMDTRVSELLVKTLNEHKSGQPLTTLASSAGFPNGYSLEFKKYMESAIKRAMFVIINERILPERTRLNGTCKLAVADLDLIYKKSC